MRIRESIAGVLGLFAWSFLALIALTACAPEPAAELVESFEEPSSSAVMAPEFVLPSLSSSALVSLTDYKGQVVYIDFWASWCAPCIRSLPILNEIRNQYVDQGFEIVSINVDENLQKAMAFERRFNLDYPVLRDEGKSVMETFDVTVMPTGILLNSFGEIVLVHLGFGDGHESFIRAHIDQELRRKNWTSKKSH